MEKMTAPRRRTIAAGLTGAIWAALMAAPGVLFAGAAIAGPFGFDLKSSVEPSRLYSFCEETDSGWFNYDCTTASKPHPDMEFYLVSFVQGVGVCGVKGVGKDVLDNRFGDYTRSEVTRIANQIKLKYGSWSKRFDDIDSYNPLWDHPADWMMSILEEERHYGYEWIFSKQRNGIGEIHVLASAINQDTGYVIVEFYTTLEDFCEKAIQRRWADVF